MGLKKYWRAIVKYVALAVFVIITIVATVHIGKGIVEKKIIEEATILNDRLDNQIIALNALIDYYKKSEAQSNIVTEKAQTTIKTECTGLLNVPDEKSKIDAIQFSKVLLAGKHFIGAMVINENGEERTDKFDIKYIANQDKVEVQSKADVSTSNDFSGHSYRLVVFFTE